MKIKKSKLLKIIRENILFLLENSLIESGDAKILNTPIVLIHRTDNTDLTYDMLDPLAIRKTRQSKRDPSSTVGLYTYESENDVPRYGIKKIEITLPKGSKILDVTNMGRGKTSRISKDVAIELIDEGFVAIKGYDFIGPPEWVILKMP